MIKGYLEFGVTIWYSSVWCHEIKSPLWFWAPRAHHLMRLGLSAFLKDECSSISRLSFPLYRKNFLFLYPDWMWNPFSSACASVITGSLFRSMIWMSSSPWEQSISHRNASQLCSELQKPHIDNQGNWFETYGWLLFKFRFIRPSLYKKKVFNKVVFVPKKSCNQYNLEIFKSLYI